MQGGLRAKRTFNVNVWRTMSCVSWSSVDELISPPVSRDSVSNIHCVFGVRERKERSERMLSLIAALVESRREGSFGVCWRGSMRNGWGWLGGGGGLLCCHGLCCYP